MHVFKSYNIDDDKNVEKLNKSIYNCCNKMPLQKICGRNNFCHFTKYLKYVHCHAFPPLKNACVRHWEHTVYSCTANYSSHVYFKYGANKSDILKTCEGTTKQRSATTWHLRLLLPQQLAFSSLTALRFFCLKWKY